MLIKARKQLDLLVIPGNVHGMGEACGQRRTEEFFVRPLPGAEPPNRKASPESAAGP